jgi:hypothetical protein
MLLHLHVSVKNNKSKVGKNLKYFFYFKLPRIKLKKVKYTRDVKQLL